MTNKAFLFGFIIVSLLQIAFWTIFLISPYLRKKSGKLDHSILFWISSYLKEIVLMLLLLVNLITVDLNDTAASYTKTF